MRAATGSAIKTFGKQLVKLSFGLRRDFSWVFTVAEVLFGIIGIDFLKHYDLLIETRRAALIDRVTLLKTCGTPTKQQSLSPVYIRPSGAERFLHLLDAFPGLIRVGSALPAISTEVSHYIEMKGHPVHSRPRRLTADKLAIVKTDFEHMLKRGIVIPSKSTWSCLIHLVPKANANEYRVCGDYRQLKKATKRDNYPIPHMKILWGKLKTAVVSS